MFLSYFQLFFFTYQNKSPFNSVVLGNAAMLSFCEAPEMLSGQGNFTLLSISMRLSRKLQHLYFREKILAFLAAILWQQVLKSSPFMRGCYNSYDIHPLR